MKCDQSPISARPKAPRAKRRRDEDKGDECSDAVTFRQEEGPTRQAARALTSLASDFDDRILEVFLRGLLRIVAVSPRDTERTAAVIRDVVDVASARQMNVEVYGSARTGIILPCSDLDFAIVPCPPPPAPEVVVAGRRVEHDPRTIGRMGALARATVSDVEPQRSVSMYSGGFSHLSKRERAAVAGQQLHYVVKALQNDRRFTRIRKILHAQVPIIKCVHRSTSCEIDFSFTTDGIQSSDYIIRQLAAPGLVLARGLIIILKALLEQWSLNDPSMGGLGSFPVALMVIWYLRSEGVHYAQGLQHSYAVHLLGFLKYYGDDFDYKNLAIDVNRMSTFSKYCTSEFIILNPLDTTRNAAKACTRFGSEVRRKFYATFKSLIDVSLVEMRHHHDASKEEQQALGTLKGMFFNTLQQADRDRAGLTGIMESRDVGCLQQLWTDDCVYYGGNVFACSDGQQCEDY